MTEHANQPGTEHSRTQVMGILNVTPDSFSDGGKHFSPEAAIAHAKAMLSEGADIIDVGGESTRPGATRISPEEEQERILPVIEAISTLGATISVDTMNPSTARAAIAAGAHIINDVSGMNLSDEMLETAAQLQVPYILMHARGTSTTMNDLAVYPRGTVTEVLEELMSLRERAITAGIAAQNLILDPGLGFAKTGDQDWELLGAVQDFQALGHRLLIAGSRKRSVANALAAADREHAARYSLPEPAPRTPEQRDAASAAVAALMARSGVWAVRVHDVRAAVDAITIVETMRKFEKNAR